MTNVGADLLGGLRDIYLEQLKTRLAMLREVLLNIKSGRAGASSYRVLQAEAHRLSGTGATYGYPNISGAARRLETHLLSEALEPGAIIRLLNPLVDAIIEALERKPVAAKTPVQAVQAPADIPIPSTAYKPTILAADDDPAVLELVRQLLSPWANIECSESGYSTLSALERRRFDLVILDYEFSDISGLEVLVHANRMKSEVRSPVMMMSATRDREKVLRLITAGAQNYLVKPISPTLLLKRVGQFLNRQRKIVLIVDDDPLIREIFRRRFAQRGHEVVVATNGVEALEVAQKIHPQAILLDRQMPRMTGNQFLKELRQRDETKNIPVIMLSAQCSTDDICSGYRDGANAYINKPFVPDQVIECCERFLDTVKCDITPTEILSRSAKSLSLSEAAP